MGRSGWWRSRGWGAAWVRPWARRAGRLRGLARVGDARAGGARRGRGQGGAAKGRGGGGGRGRHGRKHGGGGGSCWWRTRRYQGRREGGKWSGGVPATLSLQFWVGASPGELPLCGIRGIALSARDVWLSGWVGFVRRGR